MDRRTEISDLRTALPVLCETSGQLIEPNAKAAPSGVYRHVGAGRTGLLRHQQMRLNYI